MRFVVPRCRLYILTSKLNMASVFVLLPSTRSLNIYKLKTVSCALCNALSVGNHSAADFVLRRFDDYCDLAVEIYPPREHVRLTSNIVAATDD